MTSKEIIRNTIRFKGAERLPMDFPERFGYESDFCRCGMNPSPDSRRRIGADEWGSVWDCAGVSNLGEVRDFPIKNWANFDWDSVPPVHGRGRFDALRKLPPTDKYVLAGGISIYERVHFLRGLENTWADLYEEPENLCRLLDILVNMNLEVIEEYAKHGVDGFIFCDDWGLQNTLMISPAMWREFWKPRYAKIYAAAHARGMDTFLHSCGYIADILDDLIEIGLDVVHMDQQENMGLEELGKRFRGRLTFFSPADIQTVLPSDDLDRIRNYCREMKRHLATDMGGLIPCWYADPAGAGHGEAAVRAMCDAFLEL